MLESILFTIALCTYIQDGTTALMLATIQGAIHVVEFLLKHNSDVNAADEVRYR